MKIGIFFGGPSREREISFAGGRTVYDNLNKALFTPVPVFVDSHCNFIILDWEYVYKGTIRDFYPPVDSYPQSKNKFQLYIESLGQFSEFELNDIIEKVGKKIEPKDFQDHFDFAFLTLHGYFGEDGIIQGLLESVQMPYTGSGIRASSIGMDKSIQKYLMSSGGFDSPAMQVIDRDSWVASEDDYYASAKKEIRFPLVIRPANQGSSIGVSILKEDLGKEGFDNAINQSFFIKKIKASDWNQLSPIQRIHEIKEMTDIRNGIGLPLTIDGGLTVFHPDDLLEKIDHNSLHGNDTELAGHMTEQKVIVESFIHGREFSCIVIRKEDGASVAFPPTEIVKYEDLYDYRSKYLPGLSRKETPINLPVNAIQDIRSECERLFEYLDFQVYARIDGFYSQDGTIFLNDPNTTSGMLPSSFFFHQAAEIGMNPSEFLTYIIRISLMERAQHSLVKNQWERLIAQLDNSISKLHKQDDDRIKVGVILGGYSFERHISVESGRNIFEKLSSSKKYDAIPIFLFKNGNQDELYQIPISLLLKDNADDIHEKISKFKIHEVTAQIKKENDEIIEKYVDANTVFEPRLLEFESLQNHIDFAFIALHGRPGEDGSLQLRLKEEGIPYNGSDWESSHITIDKYTTLQTLKKHGFTVANQGLFHKSDYEHNAKNVVDEIVSAFDFPFIAKPVDDGCSSAVKIVKDQQYLEHYLAAIFRNRELVEQDYRNLGISFNEEFPQKDQVLIESLITSEGATRFMEITGGLLTHVRNGELVYEVFEPSEALANGEVLSLEEKFLAGEGQNITPARFSLDQEEYVYIANQVKSDLERAARILQVKGYARIDAFVRIDEKNNAETIIIEVNSLPGMTPATCIFHQSALNHYKPYQFIDKIIEFSLDEQKTI